MTEAQLRKLLPDPDAIGQAEYRTIYDFLLETLADAATFTADDQFEHLVGVLSEFEMWAADLKRTLLTQGRHELA